MSRLHSQLSEHVVVTRGEDQVLGYFVQVSDRRYARSGDDDQEEGYVIYWDQRNKFIKNIIGLT